MNWYLAKIIFRIVCGDGDHKPQFDEQLRLVAAEGREEAFVKAQQLGNNEQESFTNQKEQLVKWQFVNVSELYLLQDLIDGAELYSRIEERDNADAYEFTIHQKAENILHSPIQQLLQLV